MDLKEFNQKYGRLTLIAAAVLMWIYILGSFFFNGYVETWRQWDIPTEMPPFTDFRLIPSGAETFRSGMDPAVSNPNDPMEHIFNYPKIWYLLFYTGISQDDTIWMSIVLIVLFFLIIFAFPEKINVIDALLLLVIAFSPAAMLLYERGNLDLAFFILCGLAVILVRRFPVWAVAVLSIASIFKLFPFFGVGIFFQENKNRFYKYLFVSLLIFGIYIAFSFESLTVAWNLTQRGKVLSYGDGIIFEMFRKSIRYRLLTVMAQKQALIVLNVLPHISAALAFAVSFFLGTKAKDFLQVDSERNLTAFRMGACIYIGTFLLGNNWDYRLAFLIFTIPQLSRWITSASLKQRWPVIGIFIALLVSCWSIVIHTYYLQAMGEAYDLQFLVFDEIANWILFSGLAYLLVGSAPSWFRSFSWIPSWKEIWSKQGSL